MFQQISHPFSVDISQTDAPLSTDLTDMREGLSNNWTWIVLLLGLFAVLLFYWQWHHNTKMGFGPDYF
jgi:hypothetical protein